MSQYQRRVAFLGARNRRYHSNAQRLYSAPNRDFDFRSRYGPARGCRQIGGDQEILADDDAALLLFRDFQKPACDVRGVAGSGDVLMALRPQTRNDGCPVMTSDPDTEPIFRDRQRLEPFDGRVVEADDSEKRPGCVVGSGFWQAKNDHGAVAHETRDETVARHDFTFDHRLKRGEEIASPSRSDPFGQAGESGEVDEYDRHLLLNRFIQKSRVPQDMFYQKGRLKTRQSFLVPGEPRREDSVQA